MNQLVELAQAVGLTELDVGARGGIMDNLHLLAPAVDYYGFEPDSEECRRLQESPKAGVRSARYICCALGEGDGQFALNLYRQRGCSSKFRARADLGALFARGEYYLLVGQVNVETRPLDALVAEHGIDSPAFMKIDVQGMEVEVFRGAAQTLENHLVGIRTEVSFFPIYEWQPLFAEVDQALRPYGLVPMRWLEHHEWRRGTRAKLPKLDDGEFPWSRGQMIHGDVLYLLHPESLPESEERHLQRLVRLGLVATCFGHFDHARAAFERPTVRAYLGELGAFDPVRCLKTLSREATRQPSGLRARVRRLLGRKQCVF